MPTPLGTFAPGNYAMTYNGSSVGIIQGDGQMLRYRTHERPIGGPSKPTVPYADTKIDGIYRGLNGLLLVTFAEWNSVVKAAIWPWYTGGFDGRVGLRGQLASVIAQQIVLTAETNSPAASNGPATLTAARAKLAPENDINILFGPAERDIPVLFELLPYIDGSSIERIFSLT